eukprot:1158459-Pelagomonas_calceolata.AAC.2
MKTCSAAESGQHTSHLSEHVSLVAAASGICKCWSHLALSQNKRFLGGDLCLFLGPQHDSLLDCNTTVRAVRVRGSNVPKPVKAWTQAGLSSKVSRTHFAPHACPLVPSLGSQNVIACSPVTVPFKGCLKK